MAKSSSLLDLATVNSSNAKVGARYILPLPTLFCSRPSRSPHGEQCLVHADGHTEVLGQTLLLMQLLCTGEVPPGGKIPLVCQGRDSCKGRSPLATGQETLGFPALPAPLTNLRQPDPLKVLGDVFRGHGCCHSLGPFSIRAHNLGYCNR